MSRTNTSIWCSGRVEQRVPKARVQVLDYSLTFLKWQIFT